MLSKIKNNRFLMSLLLSCFSFIVAFMYNFTPLMQMQPDAIKFVWRSISSDVLVLLVSSSIVVSIISFICFFFGGMLNKKLNLNTKIEKKDIVQIVLSGFLPPIVIALFDVGLQLNEPFISIPYSLMNTTSSVLYFGLLEEVWLRYGFLSLMVYAFYIVFNKVKKEKETEISKKYHIIGLVFVSLFLYVVSLNEIVSSAAVLNYWVLVRAFFVYFVPNLLYGRLFLKYNIKASVLAHSIFIIMHLGIVPLLFSLI